MTKKLIAATLIVAGSFVSLTEARDRPAPPPSRYSYSLKFDAKSLPKGVSIRELRNETNTRYFIKNTSDVPLVINERFQNERLVTGSKLVSGKVLQYFPNGVPMEGKQHLKGWQAPFGEIKETLIYLPKDPDKIYEGRKPGLSKDLPPPEAYEIPAKLDDKEYKIKVTIVYSLNPAYDKHYAKKDDKDVDK